MQGVRTAGGCRIGHLGRGDYAEAGAAARPIREESPQASLGVGGGQIPAGHAVQRCHMHVARGPFADSSTVLVALAEGLGPEP